MSTERRSPRSTWRWPQPRPQSRWSERTSNRVVWRDGPRQSRRAHRWRGWRYRPGAERDCRLPSRSPQRSGRTRIGALCRSKYLESQTPTTKRGMNRASIRRVRLRAVASRPPTTTPSATGRAVVNNRSRTQKTSSTPGSLPRFGLNPPPATRPPADRVATRPRFVDNNRSRSKHPLHPAPRGLCLIPCSTSGE